MIPLLAVTKHDRLNVYIPQGKVFYLIARKAINPKYEAQRGRPYPDDEGIISKAFNSNFCYEIIPHNPEENHGQYVKYMLDKFNMKKETVEQITMKCMA